MPHRLIASDAERYITFRREMLLNAPWAFGSSVEDDRFRDPIVLQAALAAGETTILAITSADKSRILAAAGVIREPKLKRNHIAMIWGVYVTPDARSRGLGRLVVSAAIDAARSWTLPPIAAIELTVSQNAPEAQRLYQSLGFVQWGIEPDALRVGDASYAEIYMQLRTAVTTTVSP